MNLIDELRELAENLHVNGYNRYSAAMSKAADELASLERYRTAYNEWVDKTEWVQADTSLPAKYLGMHRADVLKDMISELLERLEAAEKDIALKERVIDALGSELNAVANERDALRTVLTNLLNDLEERAKWNLEESQRVVACGNGVYMRAKAAL